MGAAECPGARENALSLATRAARLKEEYHAMAKKAAAPAASGKVKPATKAEIYAHLAEQTELSKKQVASVFEAYFDWAKKELSKKAGAGVVLLPGMAKIKAQRLPATKAATKPNPFKPGEMMTVKPKPARTKIKVVALKAFKDSI
jgi:nucleoid DNA-binding protein